MQTSKAFGRWLRARRVERGFNQRQLCRYLNISQSRLSRIELGGIPSLDPAQIEKYIDLLGLSFEEYVEKFKSSA